MLPSTSIYLGAGLLDAQTAITQHSMIRQLEASNVLPSLLYWKFVLVDPLPFLSVWEKVLSKMIVMKASLFFRGEKTHAQHIATHTPHDESSRTREERAGSSFFNVHSVKLNA